jgi:hypothetical protein
VRAFRLYHALHIEPSFNESSGISNILLNLRFWYFASSLLNLVGFLNADFAGCEIDSKNTSGTCHFLISSLVCWSSKKQSSVNQSTIEAEYIVVVSYCSQILWIVHTMRDFGVIFERVPLMCDNTSAISIAKNPVSHKRMRYLKRRHHFLRNHVEKRDIEMRYRETVGRYFQ